MRAVYIHIPFCKSICSYCDFCKFIYKDKWANNYLDKLSDEINTHYEDDEIKTLYIGGGTPSSLSIENINKLFSVLSVIKLSDTNETSFECNIDDININLLKCLKSHNVNRLSIGIQSFNKYKLKYMNRKHNSEDIKSKILLCKEYGFDNINVDFIYALPFETYFMFMKDLENFIKLGIQHISTYSLIIENHTIIKNKKAIPLNEELEYKMYKRILSRLNKKDYHHYEVSNFSLHGYESMHNLTYWNNEEYYGFGLGASGFINGVRYENTRNFTKYLNNEYRLNELLISKQEDMENQLILGLRKIDGISISEFNNKYNEDIFKIFKLDEAIKKGLIIKNDDIIKISEDKIYVMNEILNMIM